MQSMAEPKGCADPLRDRRDLGLWVAVYRRFDLIPIASIRQMTQLTIVPCVALQLEPVLQ